MNNNDEIKKKKEKEKEKSYEKIFNEIKQDIMKHMSERRFHHIEGVILTAERLANMYDEDVEKARMAALLHDCAKEYSDEETKEFCIKYDVDLGGIVNYPKVIHSHLGAYVASYIYHIEDEDILNAIKYHTTGRINMSKLEKIIYISDFIEPNRDFKEKQSYIKANELIEKDLDETLIFLLTETIKHLFETNATHIAQDTISAYEYYKK